MGLAWGEGSSGPGVSMAVLDMKQLIKLKS